MHNLSAEGSGIYRRAQQHAHLHGLVHVGCCCHILKLSEGNDALAGRGPLDLPAGARQQQQSCIRTKRTVEQSGRPLHVTDTSKLVLSLAPHARS